MNDCAGGRAIPDHWHAGTEVGLKPSMHAPFLSTVLPSLGRSRMGGVVGSAMTEALSMVKKDLKRVSPWSSEAHVLLGSFSVLLSFPVCMLAEYFSLLCGSPAGPGGGNRMHACH